MAAGPSRSTKSPQVTNLPGVPEFRGELAHRTENKRVVLRLEHGEFEVCQPIEREKSEWLGLRKRRLLIHRTSDGEWDVKIT